MARLYCEVTDEKGTKIHKIGNTGLLIDVFYGSIDDSKICLKVQITYPKGAQQPAIAISKHIQAVRVYK